MSENRIDKAFDMLLEQMGQLRRIADELERNVTMFDDLTIRDVVEDICDVADAMIRLEQLRSDELPMQLPSPFSSEDEKFIEAAESVKARIRATYGKRDAEDNANYIPARWDSDGSDETAR